MQRGALISPSPVCYNLKQQGGDSPHTLAAMAFNQYLQAVSLAINRQDGEWMRATGLLGR